MKKNTFSKKIKQIIILIVPPIILSIYSYIKNLFRKRKVISTISNITKNTNDFIVVGNGPSLTDTIKKYINIIKEKDCIVVNLFCQSEYYEIIKPKNYLLVDPEFFGDINTYPDWLKNKINIFIDCLIQKTTWHINLIIPNIAINSFFYNKIFKNKFINIYFYNNKNLGNINKNTKFTLWDKNLIAPPAQTCLNTCVWLGIYLRYKNIYLIGADTSWIQLLEVDQKTNELFTTESHFYGKQKHPLYKDGGEEGTVKLHEELYCNANTFSNYWDLKDYADYAGVKVYNASEYSLIDAFERKPLS